MHILARIGVKIQCHKFWLSEGHINLFVFLPKLALLFTFHWPQRLWQWICGHPEFRTKKCPLAFAKKILGREKCIKADGAAGLVIGAAATHRKGPGNWNKKRRAGSIERRWAAVRKQCRPGVMCQWRLPTRMSPAEYTRIIHIHHLSGSIYSAESTKPEREWRFRSAREQAPLPWMEIFPPRVLALTRDDSWINKIALCAAEHQQPVDYNSIQRLA